MNKLILLLLAVLPLCAVSQEFRDVVYLKDQSIIKGKVIENSAHVLKIETEWGNVFAYTPDKILTVSSEMYQPVNHIKDTGYISYTSLGLLLGSTENEKASTLSFLSEHTYRFNKSLAAGGVIGVEFINETLVPIGLNLKAMKIINGSSTLYIGASGGYSISIETPTIDGYEVESASGGVFLNAEIGVIIPARNNTGFLIAVGYRYNSLNYLREDGLLGDVDRHLDINRLSVKVGFVM